MTVDGDDDPRMPPGLDDEAKEIWREHLAGRQLVLEGTIKEAVALRLVGTIRVKEVPPST